MGEEFNVNGILTESEISSIFGDDTEETTQETPPENQETQEENKEETTEADLSVEDIFSQSESVGSDKENKQDKEGTTSVKDSTSPQKNFYSSIANALKEDGIFQNLDEDKSFDDVKTPEDFYELINEQVKSMLDEKQKRIDEALNYGVQPSQVKLYENNIEYLKGISEENLINETEDGEKLRKEMIYYDFRNRGYSDERAKREVNKSIQAGTDIDDAKEALKSNLDFYQGRYRALIDDAKAKEEEEIKERNKEAESLKKSILESKEVFNLPVDTKTRQKIYDVISKPVYKDPDTDEYLTEIQKYEMEHKAEFRKNIGALYVLTDGFKNMDKIVKPQVKKEMKKGLRDLEGTLNSTARNLDGSLKFVSGTHSDSDESYIGNGWSFDV